MDTIIQDASKGSPILAYGRSSFSPKKKLIMLGIGILATFIALSLLALIVFFLGSAKLPSTILFALATSPSAINGKLNGALVTELPAPWRAAIESNSSFPVILGLAKTTQGTVAPFAIVAKTTSVALPEQATLEKGSLIKLISNTKLELKKTSYRSFSKLLRSKKHADASWMIDAQLLGMLANDSSINSSNPAVYGSIQGARGEILLPAEDGSGESVEGAFFVTVRKQPTPSHLISNALLSQGIDVKNIPDPDRILLKGDGTLNVAWSDLSEDEKRLVSVASNQSTSTIFELPDKDTVWQTKPTNEDAQELSSQSAWKQSSGEISNQKTTCPGSVHFSLNGEALQNLLVLIHAPSSWRERIHSFVITTDQKKNLFCINE